MPLRARLVSLCRTLLHGPALERDLDDELAAALETLAARHRERGLSPDAALRAARLELGGVEQVKEDTRRVRVGHRLETFGRDVRLAWRALWYAPTFTTVTVVTLALGIGANTAIFSLVNAVLLEPLPFPESSRLAFVWSDMTQAGYPRGPLSGPELQDLRDRSSRFSAFGAIWATTAALTGENDPEQLRIGFVSANFFETLRTGAALGRTLTTDDESTGPPTAILLSAALWQRRYGSDPDIVGRRILVNDRPTTVVGVMPAGFKLFMPPDANVPDDLQAWQLFNANFTKGLRGQMFLRVVGRLRPGATLDEARQEIAGIARDLSQEFSDYGSAGRAFTVVGLQADGVRDIRAPLLALLGGVVILLAMACVNVASLLVARASARGREVALRLALGAGHGRLFSQCLAEGLVLAALGGAAGLATARLGLRVLLSLRPQTLDRIAAVGLDARVLAFTAGTTLVLAVLFSLAPLTEVLRTRLVATLQVGGRGQTGGVRYRVRAALVVLQLALGFVLLVSAGLLTRTFQRILELDPGFRTEERLVFRVAVPGSRYRTLDAVNAFSRQLQQEVAALPGVVSVGAVSHLPFDNLPNWSTNYLTVEGEDESRARRADARAVTPSYFDAVGARLVAGRDFTEDDHSANQAVVVVDESLAARAWPGQPAVGRRLAVDPFVTGHPTVWVTVVGVVRHIRHLVLTQEVREQVYFPVRQIPRAPMAYVVRTAMDAPSLTSAVRGLLSRLDPQLPFFDVHPLADHLRDARATQRFTMMLAAVFASVALVLACVGVYGVIAYAVARREREFGVRLALGAQPRAVRHLVLREGLGLAVVGLGVGLAASFLTSPFLEGQLFGVNPRDPLTSLAAIAALGAAVCLACWVPARRATDVNPLDTLRTD
ncbi:MAG: ABC transporter permease [Vicinamibacterales bacterium]